MTHIESLIIRYVGQNSTIDESDVELNELQEMLDSSWIGLRNTIIAMTNDGTFRKLGKKSKILTLTVSGWKKFDSLMEEEDQVKLQPQRNINKCDEVEPKTVVSSELNMKRLHIKSGDVIRPVADWKVGELNSADSLELLGECAMSDSQDTYYGRWKDKFINWDTFPRK